MSLLQNMKIRRKLLLAVLPLAVLVLLATVYSSVSSRMIDMEYSQLIDHDVKTLQNLDIARAHSNRIGYFLYAEITDPDPDRKVQIDAELDKLDADYQKQIENAMAQSPDHAREIEATAAIFNKAFLDARPIRTAAMAGNTEKALNLMRGPVGAELQQSRQAAIDLVGELRASVDRRSDYLTRKTGRTILIRWIVICLGLAGNFNLHPLYRSNSSDPRVAGGTQQHTGSCRRTPG